MTYQRGVQGGNAQPVVITGTENSDGTITPGAINTEVDDLQFQPAGANTHVDGLAISSATVISNPNGGTKLLIQALTQNVRFTLDGSNPTATRGFQLKAGDPPVVIPVSATTVVTVIEEAATADLQYQWGW